MICPPYSKLIAVKRWADRGLYDVVSQNFGRLTNEDASIMLRILDHIHVVDRIFQYHLRGLPQTFQAPRSEKMPELQSLASSVREVDDWYASYVDSLAESDFEQSVASVFISGKPARMRRGEIIEPQPVLHRISKGRTQGGPTAVFGHPEVDAFVKWLCDPDDSRAPGCPGPPFQVRRSRPRRPLRSSSAVEGIRKASRG